MMSRIRERLSIAVLEELASVHPIEMDTVQSVLQHMNNLSANSKDYIPIPLVFQVRYVGIYHPRRNIS